MKITWLPEAVRNRENQIDYIAERNPLAAVELGDAIDRAIERLAEHPHSGRPGRVHESRELVVPGTPYIAAYVVKNDEVIILRFLHGAQRWPTGF